MALLSTARCLLGLLATISQGIAQDAFTSDREQVRHLLLALNDSLAHHNAQLLSTLITNDTEVWTGSGTQARGAGPLNPLLREPQFWSERTVPRLMNETAHFLSPSLAVVNAELVQYGTLGRASTPAVIILKRNHGHWRLTFFGLFPNV